MVRAVQFAFLVLAVACLAPAEALAQGETTSAIVGQVRDATNAVVPGAIVTITNSETGLSAAPRPMTRADSTSPTEAGYLFSEG